jgi:hypothetical protein
MGKKQSIPMDLKFGKTTENLSFFFFLLGSLMATGDAISQLVVERTEKFDVVRNGRFMIFGVFIGVSITIS